MNGFCRALARKNVRSNRVFLDFLFLLYQDKRKRKKTDHEKIHESKKGFCRVGKEKRNPTPDSTCAGLSSPYDGRITLFDGPLPVTLLDFNGQYSGNTVILSWSTEREINTKYFTVEKSFDLQSFFPVTNVPASGSTQETSNYKYTDNSALQAINYYRLKMVDADGHFIYSKIIEIADPVKNAIVVFPNPVNDKLFIRLAGITSSMEIIIADAKGACVKKLELKAGTTEPSINTTDLPAEVYSISVQSGAFINTQQFIKE